MIYGAGRLKMRRIIEICKGDEHRPKIEKKFEETGFLSETYKQLFFVLNEIDHEMLALKNEDYTKRSVGNNIITICGERGQGKSSTMQSFAQNMNNKDIVQKYGLEYEENKYYILDMIEPSRFEKSESVVRVILSKMFHELQKKMYSEEKRYYIENSERQFVSEIYELFQKCFSNIDYIKKNNTSNSDDLETLSRLGNRESLCEDLEKLVEKYLILMTDNGKVRPARYLVVQIDDADLATKKIFELCEDIRKYLSIPNVIILIAVDYNQMICAVYQGYLSNFEKLHNLQSHINVDEKCYEMATKYLEKMIPEGHRIVLPNLNEEMVKDFEKIMLSYVDEKNRELIPNSVNTSIDIQRQLMGWMYTRTGVLFYKENNKLHSFMPRTLRELTYMVKMLGEMQEINWGMLWGNSEENDEVRKKLRSNLHKLKRYFIDYWCTNNLPVEYKEILEQLDQISYLRNGTEIWELFQKKLNLPESKETESKDYFTFINKLEKKEYKMSKELENAVNIYFSIFFNEWFELCLENPQNIYEFIAYLHEPVQYKDKSDNEIKSKYSWFEFDVIADKNTENDKIDQAMATILIQFGVTILGENERDWKQDVCINDTQNWHLNAEKIHLNVLYPLFTSLTSMLTKKRNMMIKNNFEQQERMHSVEDEGWPIHIIDNKKDIKFIYAIRNILCNRDVQWVLSRKLKKVYNVLQTKETWQSWKEIITNVYGEIDRCLSDILYVKSDCLLQKVFFSEEIGADNYIRVFLKNKDNATAYIHDCLGDIKKYIFELKNLVSDIKSKLDDSSYLQEMTLRESSFIQIDIDVKSALSSKSFISDTTLKKISKCYDDLKKNKESLMHVINSIIEQQEISSESRKKIQGKIQSLEKKIEKNEREINQLMG